MLGPGTAGATPGQRARAHRHDRIHDGLRHHRYRADFSLVKFKKLVGGRSMQIVNQTIPQALTKLWLPTETIEAVVESRARTRRGRTWTQT